MGFGLGPLAFGLWVLIEVEIQAYKTVKDPRLKGPRPKTQDQRPKTQDPSA